MLGLQKWVFPGTPILSVLQSGHELAFPSAICLWSWHPASGATQTQGGAEPDWAVSRADTGLRKDLLGKV